MATFLPFQLFEQALSRNGSPAPEFIKDQPTSFLVKIYKRV
jgi:hypothetical protein